MTPLSIELNGFRLLIANVPIGNPGRINVIIQRWEKSDWKDDGGRWTEYGTFLSSLQIQEEDLQPILDLFARTRDLMVLK